MQEQQTGLTSPTCRTPPGQKSGHPPGSSRADLLHPGSDVTLLSNDTSTAIPETRTAHHLPDPHLTHLVRLFHIAHHDGLQPTQHVVVCRHPPHGRRRRANNLHLLHSTMLESPYLQTELPSTFVAHVGSQTAWRIAMPLAAALQDSHRNGGHVFLIFVADPRTVRLSRNRWPAFLHEDGGSPWARRSLMNPRRTPPTGGGVVEEYPPQKTCPRRATCGATAHGSPAK